MFWVVLRKELTVEWRSKEVLYTSVYFALLLSTTFMFSFFESERARDGGKLGAGILWVGLLFSATIAFSRTFLRERESGCVAGLRLVPGIHTPLFVGKMIANLVFLLVVEAVLLPAVALFFNLDLASIIGLLLFALMTATFGLSALGTLIGAALVHLKMREILLPLVLFPMLVPLLVAGVSGTEAMIRGDTSEYWDWMRLMIAFDAIYIVVSISLFRSVLEATD